MAERAFRILVVAGSLALCAAVEAAAPPSADKDRSGAATAYPTRAVRLITGSTGSTADITARFISVKLGERWGQQIVVDNRAGVGGIIGGEIVANAAPDGHTLYVSGISTQVSAPFLLKKMPFDPEKAFIPITLLTNSGLLLVVVPSVPASNLKEFIAYVRKQPNGLNYSSAAIGTSSHLTGELLVQVLGLKLNHVPYKGTGFALTALFTGEVQAAFLSTTTTSAQMKAGKLKALALLSDKRFPAVPDIPTSVEQGFRGLESYVWFGLYAPARVPRPLVDRINRDVTELLRTAEARELLLSQGAEATPTTPEEFAAFQKSEIQKWGKVIKQANVTVN